MPKGFEWISYTTEFDRSYITVDAQQRLYISAAAAKTIGLTFPAHLFVGYDHANMRLVVAKPDVVKAVNTKPFKFDARRYCSAKPFIRALGLKTSELPLRFTYAGKDFSDASVPDGSYTFQLDKFEGADDISS